MILGPITISQCSFCDSIFESFNLISGNSFGAKFYSDGKVESQLDDPLNLIKCPKCHNFIWLSKLSQIGEYELGEPKPDKWKNALNPHSLSLDELLDFLYRFKPIDNHDEIYVRVRVLWEFNNRIRKSKPQFLSSTDKSAWTINIVRLLNIMDWSIPENRLLSAELMRYFENWDLAFEILNSIFDSHLTPFVLKMEEKCFEKSIHVFQF